MTFDRYTIESFHKSHKFGGNPVFLAISNGVKQGGILSAALQYADGINLHVHVHVSEL